MLPNELHWIASPRALLHRTGGLVRRNSSTSYTPRHDDYFLRRAFPVMNVTHLPSSSCMDDERTMWSCVLNS